MKSRFLTSPCSSGFPSIASMFRQLKNPRLNARQSCSALPSFAERSHSNRATLPRCTQSDRRAENHNKYAAALMGAAEADTSSQPSEAVKQKFSVSRPRCLSMLPIYSDGTSLFAAELYEECSLHNWRRPFSCEGEGVYHIRCGQPEMGESLPKNRVQ